MEAIIYCSTFQFSNALQIFRPAKNLVLAPNSALRSQIVPEKPDHATTTHDDPTGEPAPSAQTRLKWAQLLKRVFEFDMSACSKCGGPLTLIAAPSASSGQESKIPQW